MCVFVCLICVSLSVPYVCLCLSHMCVFVCLAQPGLTCPQTPPYPHEQELKQKHAHELQKLRTSHSEQQQELERQRIAKEAVHGELKRHETENKKLKTKMMPGLLSREEQDEVHAERQRVKDANEQYLLEAKGLKPGRRYLHSLWSCS